MECRQAEEGREEVPRLLQQQAPNSLGSGFAITAGWSTRTQRLRSRNRETGAHHSIHWFEGVRRFRLLRHCSAKVLRLRLKTRSRTEGCGGFCCHYISCSHLQVQLEQDFHAEAEELALAQPLRRPHLAPHRRRRRLGGGLVERLYLHHLNKQFMCCLDCCSALLCSALLCSAFAACRVFMHSLQPVRSRQ